VVIEYTTFTAATVALQRAKECRTRVYELRARLPVTQDDVSRAKRSLELARRRTMAAQMRLVCIGGKTVWLDAGKELGSRLGELRTFLREGGVGDPYAQFVSLGGQATEFELDAFAHGVADLPATQLAVLDQAVWELRQFGG
jgi:hypothetical protein